MWEKVAAKGYMPAQYSIGHMYYFGEGVKKDYLKAKYWYEKAAAKGFADAQNSLGVLYDYRYGVKQDRKIAKKWFNKACNAGSDTACENYKKLSKLGY